MVSDKFTMNGDLWDVDLVSPNDKMLVDRTGALTVATTDPAHHKVYLSWELRGDFLMTVFVHELAHCAMISYRLIDQIHIMVKPKYWIKMEEFICNFLADFGLQIFKTAYSVMGYDAWKLIPKEFEKRIA